MRIVLDDLTGEDVVAFLDEHLADMRSASPPESKHALDLEGLRRPEVTFWTVRQGGAIAGCGALKELSPRHGEIKSMRTSEAFRRRGVAAALLRHIVDVARQRGYARLSLETGSMPFFAPARALYGKFGFEPCAPFDGYCEDPNSVYLTREL